jgi:HK97 family phage major capsid protein
MSEFIRTQHELRANLVSQIQETLDAAEVRGGLDAETTATIDRIEADIRRADDAIAVATRNEERKAEAHASAGSFVPAAESRSAGDIFRAMAQGELRGHTFGQEQRATLVPSANTVPVSFYDQVFGAARLVGPWLDVADVITRSQGNDLRIPIYTAFSTAAAVSAGSAISESNPTFDSLLIQPAKFGFIVPIANELIADAGFNIESVIAEQAGNAVGTYLNTAVTTTVVAAAGSGVTSATATAITADELITLAYSTDGAVRKGGAGYMVNSTTLGAIRKLKDTVGNYLYQVGIGQPDTFAGFPIYENPNLANIGSAAKSVLFGDFSAVKIVNTPLDVATSVDAYFANDVTAYRFAQRLGSGLTHAAKVKYLVS